MTDKIIHKVGEQSAADPYEFVMSTASVDRMGDIVEQDWKLSAFRKNPIALWNHNSGQPIGRWEKVRVEAGKLVGRLKLAEAGTSELIDTLRSLVQQRILKAVSVGFKPGDYEPLDEKDPWGGLRLMKNELFECSLVSVPANAEALSVAKALTGRSIPDVISDETVALDLGRKAAEQLGLKSRVGDNNPDTLTRPKRKSIMSLNDKIAAKTEEVAKLRASLTEATMRLGLDDGAEDESVSVEITELTGEVDKAQGELDILLKAEKSLAAAAIERTGQKDDTPGAPAPRIETRQKRKKGHAATATLSCLLKAHVLKTSPYDVAKHDFKDESDIPLLIKAATNNPFTRGIVIECCLEQLMKRLKIAHVPANNVDECAILMARKPGLQ